MIYRNRKFPVLRKTKIQGIIKGINYYVDKDFSSVYGRDRRSLRRVEMAVEQTYVNNLQSECRKQKTKKRHMLYKAQRSHNKEKVATTYNMKMPACDELNSMLL